MARLTDRPRRNRSTDTADRPAQDADRGALRPDPAVEPPGGGRSRMPRTFESFRDREFRWFYIAMLGQMGAMNMQLVVRGYLAYVLTGSYAALGLIGLAGAAPMLLLSVFGGVVADRQPKRTILQFGQVLSLLNALALAALMFTGVMRIEWLLVSALAQGIVMALTMPARQAMIPDIVGLDRMMNAVSLNMAGMNTMRLFAPAAGGFIVSAVGFGWAFGTMAALYGVALVGLARVTWQPATAPGDADASLREVGSSSLRDIADGMRYIVRDHKMAALLSLSFLSAIFGMPYQFLLPGYVDDIFAHGADNAAALVGLLMSISAIGALAGALVLATIPNRNRGWMLIGGSITLGVGLFAFAQTANFWVAAAFIIIVGVGSAFRQALSMGLLHTNVENAYRGRVMSVFMTQMSVMQLSTFFVGVTAEFVGIRVAFAGLGVGLIIVTLIFAALVPSVRRMD
ncbi:MAG: MFS transporter [Dehalococcoidia bacterium]